MNGFVPSLLATGPAPDRAAAMATYGWLVGGWSFDATIFGDHGATAVAGGEIHAAWVLEGRAIQDVWTLPGVFAGSTLRVYDPGIDAWHILWSDPLHQYYNRQIGRRAGERIVQEGTDAAGQATRWSFNDIAGDRFRWLGEKRLADGSWQLVADFSVRRHQTQGARP
jgi:hypothetical protein